MDASGRGASSKRECPRCSQELVAIETEVGEHLLALVSCSRCSTRQWLRDGEDADLVDVLRELQADRRRLLHTPVTHVDLTGDVEHLVASAAARRRHPSWSDDHDH